jgi:cohesin complex subunit SA-1/2
VRIVQAYTLVLDGLVRDESNATHLAKLLSNCFIVRGTHLSILRRISAQHIIQIHTNLLTWVSKRLAAYENNKNKSSFKAAVAFLRVLVPLLATLGSRDALKMCVVVLDHLMAISDLFFSKAHLEQVLAEANVEVSTSKLWDPYRAYEKRLSTIMAKDEGMSCCLHR